MEISDSKYEPIDDEERSLMEAIERGDTKPVPKKELEAIKASIKGTAHNITSRMNDDDIDGMKAKASRLRINYQTLIKTLVHRYLNGGVTINEAF